MDRIETPEQYQAALRRMGELKDARYGTPEGEELDAVATEVMQYECANDLRDRPQSKRAARLCFRLDDLASRWYRIKTWVTRHAPVKQLDTAWYWLRTHTKDRYHLVDLRGAAGYKWGWIDRSHALFIANFKIFQDFYEKEYPGLVFWPPTVKREIEELYTWWTKGRDEEAAAVLRLWEKRVPAKDYFGGEKFATIEDGKAWRRAHLAWEKRDDEMLLRLMAIRGTLWT